MKKLISISLFSALSVFSSLANAAVAAPEMDASSAVIGLGLLSGIVALIAERRRK